MNLCLINHNFRYELEKLIRIFLPFEKIEFFDCEIETDCSAITEIVGNCAAARLNLLGKKSMRTLKLDENAENYDTEAELKLATALFECFIEITGYTSQWGILTGVRPAKLFSRLTKSLGYTDAKKYFSETLRVSDKKIALCEETYKREEAIVSLSDRNSFSLYISIPFCPTRCSYCSFVSHSVESARKLIPIYIEKLCEEITLTAKTAEQNNLKLETVYIGGGTPTAIEAEQLEKIMKTVSESFDLSSVREYTVEAGRPDTVTKEKLEVIKQYGATRISINPQTMNDACLERIGRRHTSAQTVDAFMLARAVGFNNINMDLIAGLPEDTYDSFKSSLEQVCALEPESVTVHSLSVKRSSRLNVSGDLPEKAVGDAAALMVDFAHDYLAEKGIAPYYMYRQSKTVGNLENVGYSKSSFECLYNVYIMDETHSILACGASAVTKLREPGGNFIDRIFNFKYPYEYIDRFDEIIGRKKGICDFYSKYC